MHNIHKILLNAVTMLVTCQYIIAQDPFALYQKNLNTQNRYHQIATTPESEKWVAVDRYVVSRLEEHWKTMCDALPALRKIKQNLDKESINITTKPLSAHEKNSVQGLTEVNEKNNSIEIQLNPALFSPSAPKAFTTFVIDHELTHVIQAMCSYVLHKNKIPIIDQFTRDIKRIVPISLIDEKSQGKSIGTTRCLNIVEHEADMFALIMNPYKEQLLLHLQRIENTRQAPQENMSNIAKQSLLNRLLSEKKSYTADEYHKAIHDHIKSIHDHHMKGYLPINWQEKDIIESNVGTDTEQASCDFIQHAIEARLQELLYEKYCYSGQQIPEASSLISEYVFINESEDSSITLDFDQKTATIFYDSDPLLALETMEEDIDMVTAQYFKEQTLANSASENSCPKTIADLLNSISSNKKRPLSPTQDHPHKKHKSN
ncbi:hypothetical protein KJZ61_00430 [Candidatus Dependentiae bacterium]|nr:hypothetical protein [Candidatus Dependentiae bacterium]